MQCDICSVINCKTSDFFWKEQIRKSMKYKNSIRKYILSGLQYEFDFC